MNQKMLGVMFFLASGFLGFAVPAQADPLRYQFSGDTAYVYNGSRQIAFFYSVARIRIAGDHFGILTKSGTAYFYNDLAQQLAFFYNVDEIALAQSTYVFRQGTSLEIWSYSSGKITSFSGVQKFCISEGQLEYYDGQNWQEYPLE
ncbi:MAG: hypothetical protein ACXVBW_08100 [Bdellovibrionota bacterium]